jgi:hypothetical protein
MFRIDPRQRGHLTEIAQNLQDRVSEARANGWLGEVHRLQVSPEAVRKKLASLDRLSRNNNRTGPVDIGLPVIPG